MSSGDRIGITLGDPASVGPEIICKALSALPAEERAAIIVIGSAAPLARAAELVGAEPGLLSRIRIEEVACDDLPSGFGKVDVRGGEASYRYIARAVEMAQSDEIGCIVTAPISKEALNAAGHHFDGHTGMLAALTGAKSSFMLLASDRMSVVHVSTHVSLHDAIERLTSERVLATIKAGHAHFERIGRRNPRIAVAGINPHCGENGLFGREDEEKIAPAIAAAREDGIDVHGPISADTLFYRAHNGSFDLVVAQYHDQGHIPMKLIAFDTAVNVTLGLPIDRCSVDHGTAFDIAGTGKANHINMLSAIAYARKLTASKR